MINIDAIKRNIAKECPEIVIELVVQRIYNPSPPFIVDRKKKSPRKTGLVTREREYLKLGLLENLNSSTLCTLLFLV
jgi:hypothetical protein